MLCFTFFPYRIGSAGVRVYGDNNETKKLVCGRADLKVKYLSKQVVATFFDLVNRHLFFLNTN